MNNKTKGIGQKRVLILNRGEIAFRAMTEAKNLNLYTIGISHKKERGGLIEQALDKSIIFGDETAGYTDLVFIRNLIESEKIDFLYPGYGFLSESPSLAALCEEMNVHFIGPSSTCLEALSSKKESAKYAKKMGLNILEFSNPLEVEFPLMLKASMGGGGRGNLVVHSKEELKNCEEGLKAKSLELFQNSEILHERYLPNARHIELQIMATKNQVYFFGSRDCSLQMRFQKIMEEGPSCPTSQDILKNYYAQIEKTLIEMGYLGAGTIEFLYDDISKSLYFLEMNTRIQVEHTVSEMLYQGTNLVRLQFQIAMNEPIQITTRMSGHSFCVRIYALDPSDGFIPTLGRVHHLKIPDGARFDSYLEVGTEIMAGYDPMIGKLMVHGENREDAILKLKSVLREFQIHGVKTTLPFIISILEDTDFTNNDHDISWVEEIFLDKEKLFVNTDLTSDELEKIRSSYIESASKKSSFGYAYKDYYKKRYLR